MRKRIIVSSTYPIHNLLLPLSNSIHPSIQQNSMIQAILLYPYTQIWTSKLLFSCYPSLFIKLRSKEYASHPSQALCPRDEQACACCVIVRQLSFSIHAREDGMSKLALMCLKCKCRPAIKCLPTHIGSITPCSESK